MAGTSFSPHSPAGLLVAANRTVSGVDEVLWAAKTPDEIVDTVAACEVLRAHLAAIEAAALAEVEDRKIAKQRLAWSSSGDWFTHLAGTHPRTGRRAVRHAKLLVGERSLTRDALRDGLVSPEQAAVIVDALEELPTNPHLREQAEKTLLDEAGRLHAGDLAKAARHLAHVIDPDGAEKQAEKDLAAQDRAAHLGRYLALTDDGAGGVRLRGRGTVEDAARIRAALLPLTKPTPATEPGTGTDCAEVEDVRDHGARMWDALVDVATIATHTRLVPDAHGARPRITVTTSLDALKGAIDWTTRCDDGTELSPAAVRRLACDADIIPVALGTHGEVLDVGRAHRLVTPALWRALVCRDRHCAFPGCTRPPVMGHAHHITHWADHGPTALHNLVLLCGHHHRTIHHTPWQVRLNPHDGKPEFLPPPRPGHHQPPPQWIRQRPRRE
jgi:hypothetical protein